MEKEKSKKYTITWDNPNGIKTKSYEVYVDGKFMTKVNNEKVKLNLNNGEYIINLVAVNKYGLKSEVSENLIIK